MELYWSSALRDQWMVINQPRKPVDLSSESGWPTNSVQEHWRIKIIVYFLQNFKSSSQLRFECFLLTKVRFTCFRVEIEWWRLLIQHGSLIKIIWYERRSSPGGFNHLRLINTTCYAKRKRAINPFVEYNKI